MRSTFKTRLAGILLVINLAVLMLGASSYYFLGQVGGRLDTFTQGIYRRLEIANQLREAADVRAIAVRNFALLTGDKARATALQDFERSHKETNQALAELKQAVARADTPAEVREKVDAIVKVEAVYGPVAVEIMDMLKAGRRDEALARIEKECSPTLTQLSSAIHGYMAMTERRTRGFVEETFGTTTWQRRAMVVAALAALAVSLLLGYLLWSNVRRTLGAEPEELNKHLGKLADGYLGLDLGRDAPRGSVLEAVGRTQRQMRQVVEQVRLVSDSIATGSTQIATGNADLSQRTELQAGNLQRTASAMEQMNRSVQSNADSAKTASGLANAVSGTASNGGEVMQRVTSTMADIHQSSARINDIIGVIDGIAFQTNILALNAAVEAARAGEQGRGFAVVASEVRLLAQRSAEAAKEIKSLISASVARVDAGTVLVDEAGQAVGNIVSEVRRVADLIQEIGHSALEQSAGIAEVSGSVAELDQSTQQNAALAEQSAAAADSLRQQSRQLATAVGYFKL